MLKAGRLSRSSNSRAARSTAAHAATADANFRELGKLDGSKRIKIKGHNVSGAIRKRDAARSKIIVRDLPRDGHPTNKQIRCLRDVMGIDPICASNMTFDEASRQIGMWVALRKAFGVDNAGPSHKQIAYLVRVAKLPRRVVLGMSRDEASDAIDNCIEKQKKRGRPR